MPDRAIIPFTVAVMGGFVCGLIGSVLALQTGAITAIAVAGCVATALAAGASVLGCEGEDRPGVGVLRAFYGVCVFLAVDLGLVTFLRDGRFLPALVLLAGGAVAAGMLATPRVAAREDRAQSTG